MNEWSKWVRGYGRTVLAVVHLGYWPGWLVIIEALKTTGLKRRPSQRGHGLQEPTITTILKQAKQ